MATIDYKEKYEQAMERARQFIEKPYLEDSAGIVRHIFPELAESDDERIRKNLIACISTLKHPLFSERERKEFSAWLEKQGKPSNTIHYWTEEEIEPIISDYLRGVEHYGGMIGRLRCLKPKSLEKQGEQKSNIVPIFKVGDIIKNKKNGDTVKVEQILIDSYCYSGWDGAATIHSDFLISDQGNWELVEQKPAWSEEDQEIWEEISNLLWDGFKKTYTKFSWDEIKGWIKPKIESFKVRAQSQSHWKPTDEQMNALNDVISSRDIKYDVLSELWKDLNKIREE